jgi:hypothetical protein
MVTLEKEYLLGPAITVESVEVDRVEFPFRQFDPTKIVIFDESDSGNCPFVYCYSSKEGTWHNEGVILFGRTGPEKESLDEKALSAFEGRILIFENDPEDSFIDSVYVRAISDNGRETGLYPRDSALRSIDGRRMKLRQGQRVILGFDAPKNLNARRFILGAVGYYVPYRQSPINFPNFRR